MRFKKIGTFKDIRRSFTTSEYAVSTIEAAVQCLKNAGVGTVLNSCRDLPEFKPERITRTRRLRRLDWECEINKIPKLTKVDLLEAMDLASQVVSSTLILRNNFLIIFLSDDIRVNHCPAMLRVTRHPSGSYEAHIHGFHYDSPEILDKGALMFG